MISLVGLAVVSLSVAQLDGGSSALAVAIAKAHGRAVERPEQAAPQARRVTASTGLTGEPG
jgi:hypothetical protein